MEILAAQGQWLALMVKIPQAGYYTGEVEYLGYGSGGVAKLYLIPYTADFAVNPNKYFIARYDIGSADTYRETGLMDTTTLGKVYVPETESVDKEYILVMISAGEDASKPYLLINKVSFYGFEDKNPLQSVSMAELGSVEAGQTKNIALTGVYADSSTTNLETATKTYESSNELVATVDENGVITGVAGGTADITVTVTLDGETFSDTKTITVTGDPGLTKVEMNADPEPDAGKEFLFWMDPVSKRLVSNQQQVTFTVGTDTQITAIYKDAGQGHIVIFFDKNGKVLSNEYLADGASITAPENPYSVGYIFSGWSPAVPATANGDYAFVAQYEEEEDVTYTVTVENGSISPSGGSYKYNTQVTVTAGDFESGRKFAYWTKNGVIVSYSPNYSFYVWDDTEIRAVSVPEADNVTAAPAIYMDEAIKVTPVNPENPGGPRRVIFASERTLPAGFTLIETGILASTAGVPDLDDYFYKAIAKSSERNGQFTARIDNVPAGTPGYARAYMIYRTPGGDYKVIYSNTVGGIV